jgi:hypothetical protein
VGQGKIRNGAQRAIQVRRLNAREGGICPVRSLRHSLRQQGADAYRRGADGSNPSPSSGEPFCEPDSSTGAHHGEPTVRIQLSPAESHTNSIIATRRRVRCGAKSFDSAGRRESLPPAASKPSVPPAEPEVRIQLSPAASQAKSMCERVAREVRWHEDAPQWRAPLGSSTDRLTGIDQTPKLCQKPVSPFIIAPRAQASRRCETQAPLGGKPPSFATVSIP